MVAPSPLLSHPVGDYTDAERLLLSRVREDPRPYAGRARTAGRAVSRLLALAGNPEAGLRVLHLAGSKGKGSAALFAEHLLLDLDEPTGTYTSPHLRRWNERIRVNGAPIADVELCAVLDALRPHVATLDAASDDDAPSFFDLVTAAGLLAFARAGCRTVVLETGLGGLYDATNVVAPAACAITSIELEHTDKLGATLAEVARHKAGIIKRGVPVVTGDLPPEALRVIEARARDLGCAELRSGRDWVVSSAPGEPGTRRVHYRAPPAQALYEARFTSPHPAPHMAVNAGLALTLVRSAGFVPRPASLQHCVLPARAQVVQREPWIVVDGAHTGASLGSLGESLADFPATRRRFLVSATRGKSLDALTTLMTGADRILVTRADEGRSAPAADLAARLSTALPGIPIRAMDDPDAALAAARDGLAPDDLLCVCGSVYLAGFALSVLAPEHVAGD